ncbi:peptide-N4-asparagine amidase [Rhizosaccharibacter radicis]|uniref:Peptide N-acetyl-beta-D-glucosaminyl asparaginase amidase A N-terminal domain-containing protein n=1 Tax=Rhizosaccharibacter radicis TaxID=2782605 RepID=A0ABT1VXP2_9PROT|nr:hypothetical protein [Acetobacteraceae bacterium KSS12]
MRLPLPMLALLVSATALSTGIGPGIARAQGVVGTGNPAPIEPDPSHPDEAPCRVPLFTGATFGADAVGFTYQPPASCPGPWAKVILSTDVSVQAGRQFDRTASIWLAGVNLLFGTTAEPRAALAPSWHVERDVTDDTALLRSSQPGHVLIANYQSSVYTSTITASAALLFYPATRRYPAPRTPDLVVPLQSDPAGGTTDLADGTLALSRTGTLPTNIEGGYLETYLQSQGNDEFWYTCVPDALADELQTCGGGNFREGQVSIDGVRAGVAPVYPWIYTGGIDPYLWQPIPGVQTLRFEPYRVELTPFAGAMDDGRPHTISLSVAGAHDRFSVTGTLYLFLDKNSRSVRGAVVRNTLSAPAPTTSNTVTTAGGNITGGVSTRSTHDYEVSGWALTSHGLVSTTVRQSNRFSNEQQFSITDTSYDQRIRQRTDTVATVTTAGAGGLSTSTRSTSYPLDLRYASASNADGSSSQTTSVAQSLRRDALDTRNGVPVAASALLERVSPTDTLAFDASGALSSHAGSSDARFVLLDSAAGCIDRHATATNSLLTAFTSGTRCDPAALAP